MFTGLIQALGKVLEYEGNRLTLTLPFARLELGESISVNGVCLTLTALLGRRASFDVGPETRRVTTLDKLRPREMVNLERALRVGDRLGGHWVTGHVDAVGVIERNEPDGPNRWITLRLPASCTPYVVSKGSLAVDGVSLTVATVRGATVRFMIVPHTLENTTLGTKQSGHRVNVEPDILAKYVLRQHS